MANKHQSSGLRADVLQRPEPAHLQGDVIISVLPAERGRCGVTYAETDVAHAGRIFPQWSKIAVWGCKMNPLKIFESDEARIKDDRFKKFISLKR